MHLYLIALLFTVTQVHSLANVPSLSDKRIVLLHMHDNAPFFSDLGALTLSNKLRYAARHGYEVAAHTPAGSNGLWREISCDVSHSQKRPDGKCYEPSYSFQIDSRAPTFGKIKLALASCVGRSDYWMLWSDADAMVVNQSLPLSSVIDDRFDMMLSVDWLMINAGMILFKCTPWTQAFLLQVYAAREFDDAQALDQSAFQHFIDKLPDRADHIGYAPKHRMNTYVEEYQPGDFLLHMAGKLYEATTAGATAIANQFDVLSMVSDPRDVDAFFRTRYLLNKYAGVCTREGEHDSACKPDDPERLKLDEPLDSMSSPNRYRHVALRYYFLPDWKDVYDLPDWDLNRQRFAPNASVGNKENGLNVLEDDELLVVLRDAANEYLAGMKYIPTEEVEQQEPLSNGGADPPMHDEL